MVAIVCAIVGIMLASAVYGLAMERRRARGALAARRARWGKPFADARETDGVFRYHELRRAEPRAGTLEDSAWRDLGMEAVHAHLDRAETFAGRARLHDRLRVPSTDLAALRRFDEAVTPFEKDTAARERVQSVLASSDPYGQDAILEVLHSRLPSPSPMRHLFPVVAGLTVAALAASPFVAGAPVAAAALVLGSLALRVAHGRRMLGWMASLRATSALLGVAGELGALSIPALDRELAALRAARGRLGTLARTTAWLSIDTLRGNEFVVMLISYVNYFLLVDITALHYAFRVL
ncbi:MAG TPA: hypothetical protein VHS09_14325, partial [Polyangiaceae bacterium]|nr:hypothetical protein [Polyangiaceae bacterium]